MKIPISITFQGVILSSLMGFTVFMAFMFNDQLKKQEEVIILQTQHIVNINESLVRIYKTLKTEKEISNGLIGITYTQEMKIKVLKNRTEALLQMINRQHFDPNAPLQPKPLLPEKPIFPNHNSTPKPPTLPNKQKAPKVRKLPDNYTKNSNPTII